MEHNMSKKTKRKANRDEGCEMGRKKQRKINEEEEEEEEEVMNFEPSAEIQKKKRKKMKQTEQGGEEKVKMDFANFLNKEEVEEEEEDEMNYANFLDKEEEENKLMEEEEEQSTKWDKLEGKLTSGFVLIEGLKVLKPLSKDILFPETIEGNIFGQIIQFVFQHKNEIFQSRFAQEWLHIPTKEKSDLAKKLLNSDEAGYRLFLVGPKGFTCIDYFVLVVLN